MSELIQFATSWKTYLTAVLVFSLAPDVVLHLAVLAYPPRHPRRQELVAELKVVPRRERPFWVAEQVTSVLVEGISQRSRARRARVARPVRTIRKTREGAPVGDLLTEHWPEHWRSSRRLAIWFAVFGVLPLVLLPIILAVFPAISGAVVFGMRLSWLLMGLFGLLFFLGVSCLYLRKIGQLEEEFADDVQASAAPEAGPSTQGRLEPEQEQETSAGTSSSEDEHS